MTILSVCQEASVVLNQGALPSLFSSADTFPQELRVLANEAARDIATECDWQTLTTLQTMTGDGTKTAFDLPADYDRMPVKSRVMTSQFAEPMIMASDLDEWLELQVFDYTAFPGYYIILGGQMQFKDALSTGVEAKFYYQRNTIVKGQDGTLKTTFTADDDTFILPERLLKLALIWRWRATKRYEYAEDMQNYEVALSQEATRDKGSRVIAKGGRWVDRNTRVAWPWSLG